KASLSNVADRSSPLLNTCLPVRITLCSFLSGWTDGDWLDRIPEEEVFPPLALTHVRAQLERAAALSSSFKSDVFDTVPILMLDAADEDLVHGNYFIRMKRLFTLLRDYCGRVIVTCRTASDPGIFHLML